MRGFTCLLIVVAGLLIGSCRTPTCRVSCGGTLYYVFTGYTKAELDSVVVTESNGNGGSFSATMSSSYLRYPAPNDSLSDTLLMIAVNLNSGFSESLSVFVSSDNRTYNFTNFHFGGDIYEDQPCHEGSPTPGFCVKGPNPYLISYHLNGHLVSFTRTSMPYDTTGYIYVSK